MIKGSTILIDIIPMNAMDDKTYPQFPTIIIIKAVRVDVESSVGDSGKGARAYLMLEQLPRELETNPFFYKLKMHIFEPELEGGADVNLHPWLEFSVTLDRWKLIILDWLDRQELQTLAEQTRKPLEPKLETKKEGVQDAK